MTQAVGLLATLWAAPGRIDDLIEAFTTMMQTVEQETGTLAYGLHRVSGDREGVVVYELYRDAAAQQRHGSSYALALLKARLPELLGAAPEMLSLMPIANAKGLPF